MSKKEVFWLIRRNKLTKREAVTLLSDFLVTSRKIAEKIYEEEFENEQ